MVGSDHAAAILSFAVVEELGCRHDFTEHDSHSVRRNRIEGRGDRNYPGRQRIARSVRRILLEYVLRLTGVS